MRKQLTPKEQAKEEVKQVILNKIKERIESLELAIYMLSHLDETFEDMCKNKEDKTGGARPKSGTRAENKST